MTLPPPPETVLLLSGRDSQDPALSMTPPFRAGEQPGFCGLGEVPSLHGLLQAGEYFLAPLWTSAHIELFPGWDVLNVRNHICGGDFHP